MKTFGEFTADGRSFRFTPDLNAESERFEEELRGRLTGDLAWGQAHCYLKETPREFRLFQMRDPDGAASMQAAVYVGRSRLYRGFAQASIPRMAPATSAEEEARGLELLRRLCLEQDFMTLRLRPYRQGEEALDAFEARARAAGFTRVPAVDVTRTLLVDLKPEPDAILAAMKKSARQKIRHKSRETVTITRLEGPDFIARCREAEKASRGRTSGGSSGFDFETFFRVAQAAPDRAFACGMFLKSRPGELLAFLAGIRHGKVAEYATAGSFHDPELRAVPFNSLLMWELILWARACGAEELDLGGVTPGGPGDKLAGISEFKRYFSDREVEVGREMLTTLRPARSAVFSALHGVRQVLAPR